MTTPLSGTLQHRCPTFRSRPATSGDSLRARICAHRPGKASADLLFWFGAGLFLAVMIAGSLAVRRWNQAANLDSSSAAHTMAQGPRPDYRQERAIPMPLQQPRGIALGPGRQVLVAGDRSIVELIPHPHTIATLDGEPRCLCAPPSGLIYVGVANHVEVIGSGGAVQARWAPAGPRSFVTSIAASGAQVAVADAGEREVLLYNTNGQLLGRVGQKGSAPGVPGLIIPSPHLDVAWRDATHLFVNDPGRHRVELYEVGGKLIGWWGIPSTALAGFSGCCNPTDLALLPDGRVVTAEKGIPRVKVYTQDGRLAGLVAGPDRFQELDAGMDLATDSEGRIFVLDPRARLVRVFVKQGAGD